MCTEGALLEGKTSAAKDQQFSSLFSFAFRSVLDVSVSESSICFQPDGLDMMGGADGEAIDRLLDDYLLSEEMAFLLEVSD